MPTRTRLVASSLVAVLLVALLAAVQLATAPVASASAGAFVSMINSERAAAGLPGLSSSGSLASVAASWSQQMASSGNLAHNPSLTSQVSGWRYIGENVGYGPDAGTIHRALMNSSAHRANILDSDYTQVGVGVATDGSGRMWVTQVFRLPTGASAPAASSQGSSPASGGSSSSGSSGSSSGSSKGSGSSNSSGSTRRAPAPPPPPPPPSPEELLRGRASAAVAGPGAAPVADPLAQALRFSTVMAATHG